MSHCFKFSVFSLKWGHTESSGNTYRMYIFLRKLFTLIYWEFELLYDTSFNSYESSLFPRLISQWQLLAHMILERHKWWLLNTRKKAEHRRIDAFNLWCWRRLLRVPWTSRRSNQSILKEINPEYSLEGLMLKLKLPILWPPRAKSWLIGKDPNAGKDWAGTPGNL